MIGNYAQNSVLWKKLSYLGFKLNNNAADKAIIYFLYSILMRQPYLQLKYM